MTAAPEELLADVDDAAIEAMVRAASPPALLAALAQATGDLGLLRDDLRPDPEHVREPTGGLIARAAAGRRASSGPRRCRRLRDGEIAAEPTADRDALRAIMEFALGEPFSDAYFSLLLEELALPGEDLRAPSWRKDDIDPDRPFRVAVVGAGMSGLAAAYRLRQAGVSVEIFEKNDDVGGTWWENRYPGCRVDVPNHLYSYSFAQRDDWPQQFSSQDVLLDYFRRCTDDLELRSHIRFRTEVLAAEFCEDSATWKLTIRNPDGNEETLEVNALVERGRPAQPAEPAADHGPGVVCRTVVPFGGVGPLGDLRGKRVAVIGTGASGFQLIPKVAEEASDLTVFQRTPNWFIPTPQYTDDMTEPMKLLFRVIPGYGQWYRLWLFWRLAEGLLQTARVDPDWPRDGGSVSARNEELRGLAHALPRVGVRRRARAARAGDPRVPAAGEADAPRQRHLGAHVEARRRAPRDRRDRSDHSRRRDDGRRSRITRST